MLTRIGRNINNDKAPPWTQGCYRQYRAPAGLKEMTGRTGVCRTTLVFKVAVIVCGLATTVVYNRRCTNPLATKMVRNPGTRAWQHCAQNYSESGGVT